MTTKKLASAFRWCRCPERCYSLHTLNLIQAGDSVGAVCPKEWQTLQKLKDGDEFHVTTSPEG
jgi:hypothetical protein